MESHATHIVNKNANLERDCTSSFYSRNITQLLEKDGEN